MSSEELSKKQNQTVELSYIRYNSKQKLTPMWHKLGSPPENFRFYKYSQNSAENEKPFININLDQNRTTLFVDCKNQHLKSVPEESLVVTYGEAVSEGTNKPLSSLKSTTKINNSNRNQKSAFDLNIKAKPCNAKKQVKSMFESSSKKKPVNSLSQKNQKSSVIRQEGSIVTNSSKMNASSNKKQDSFVVSVNNQEEEESFSQIMIKQINKTEFSGKLIQNSENAQPNYFYQMVMTLRQLKDISKQNLAINKKLVKLMEDKSQISFLYDKEEKYNKEEKYDKEQKSETKLSKVKKQDRKSFKKNNQKSTIKKLGKSLLTQERLTKVEEKVKALYKKIQDDSCNKKLSALSRTRKKSLSAIR